MSESSERPVSQAGGAGLRRRTFLGLAAGAAAAVLTPRGASAAPSGGARPRSAWPSRSRWQELRRQVGERLIRPQQPWARLAPDAVVPAKFRNPWYLEEQAGATQSTGMFKAWQSTASEYAVAAESSEDIVAAVNFARDNGVRLVVKGTGHDYYGRSCGPRKSLLIWTHNMRKITVHEEFRPHGAPPGLPAVPAVTTTAGNRWLEAYTAASSYGSEKYDGLYIQGGGCTSVGACGGFALGGGFGSFSKRFGSGAGGVLEITVVLASGKVVVANDYQNSDLFWALRGGGGGTFGVVTHMTLLAHPEPSISGWISGPITAKSDAAFVELLQRYVEFAGTTLIDPTWGEGVILNPDYGMAHEFDRGLNVMQVGSTFLDISVEAAEAAWEPFLAPLKGRPDDFTVSVSFSQQPFKNRWHPTTNEAIFDTRRNAPMGYYWWKGNASEVSAYWGAYDGRGVPWTMTQGSNAKTLAQGLCDASRTSLILWQTNKALYGEHPEAKERDLTTSINPAVFDNVAFITVGAWKQGRYPGIAGHEPSKSESQAQFDGVMAASAHVHEVTPGGGSYSNEGNYFQDNWQQEFWGSNYARLLKIKKKYDPTNLFTVHKGVGSEGY
ncbi:MAG: FAD-binding protein [Actinomycetota bacterium]